MYIIHAYLIHIISSFLFTPSPPAPPPPPFFSLSLALSLFSLSLSLSLSSLSLFLSLSLSIYLDSHNQQLAHSAKPGENLKTGRPRSVTTIRAPSTKPMRARRKLSRSISVVGCKIVQGRPTCGSI